MAGLYNFNGEAFTPENIFVISWDEISDNAGNVFKRVTDLQQFATYEEAQAFLAEHTTENYRIVGANPIDSPVPLEALNNYTLVHDSKYQVQLADQSIVPAVKIFEHTK